MPARLLVRGSSVNVDRRVNETLTSGVGIDRDFDLITLRNEIKGVLQRLRFDRKVDRLLERFKASALSRWAAMKRLGPQ
jgi:hypothetical protein